MLDALLAGLRAKDRRALARLISLTARGQHLDAIRAAVVKSARFNCNFNAEPGATDGAVLSTKAPSEILPTVG